MSTISKVAFVAAAAILSTPAMAADVLAPQPEIFAGASLYDWTGFYLGANAGLAGGSFEHPFSLTDPATGTELLDGSADITSNGFFGGVQAGYNHQFDNFVVGLEGDIQFANIEGSVTASVTDVTGALTGTPGTTLDLEAGTSVDWLATIRPRLGFVHNQALFYVTGGLAYGDVTSSVSAEAGGVSAIDESETEGTWGYAVGGGVELAMSESITFKTEYLYTDLGENELFDAGGFEISNDVQFHSIRAGVNFHF